MKRGQVLDRIQCTRVLGPALPLCALVTQTSYSPGLRFPFWADVNKSFQERSRELLPQTRSAFDFEKCSRQHCPIEIQQKPYI